MKFVRVNNLLINIGVLIISILIFIIVSEVFFRIYVHFESGDERVTNYWFNEKRDYEILWEGLPQRDISERNISDDDFHIVAIGDSFTAGDGYENGVHLESYSYPRQLEFMLNKHFSDINDIQYHVSNFAIGGSVPHEHVMVVSEYVIAHNPDLIIWGITNNDIRVATYNLDPIRYCDIDVSPVMYIKNWFLRTFQLYTFLSSSVQNMRGVYPMDKDLHNSCYEQSIINMDALLKEQDIPFVIVYISDIEYAPSISSSFYKYFPEEIYNIRVEQISSLTSAHIIEPLFLLEHNLGEKLFSNDLSHFSSSGNRYIAVSIMDNLLSKKLIPSCYEIDCKEKWESERVLYLDDKSSLELEDFINFKRRAD